MLKSLAVGVILTLMLSALGETAPSFMPNSAHLTAFAGSCAGTPSASATFTVTNAQASGTGTYDQLLSVNSTNYSAYINSNWTNVRFFNLTGGNVSAWIEANASVLSVNTLVWVRLSNIAAHSSATFVIGFYPRTAFCLSLSGPIGIAPQLTTPYGAWDDGPAVFNAYWNFSTAAEATGWTATNVVPVYSNGANLTSSTNGYYIQDPIAKMASAPNVTDALFESSHIDNDFTVVFWNAANDLAGGQTGVFAYRFLGTDTNTGYHFRNNVFYLVSMGAPASGGLRVGFNESTLASNSSAVAAGRVRLYTQFNTITSKTSIWDYFRVRTSPPNGIMPSVVFTLVIPPSGAPVVISALIFAIFGLMGMGLALAIVFADEGRKRRRRKSWRM